MGFDCDKDLLKKNNKIIFFSFEAIDLQGLLLKDLSMCYEYTFFMHCFAYYQLKFAESKDMQKNDKLPFKVESPRRSFNVSLPI